MDYLKNYSGEISVDLDLLWNNYDYDGNGVLDRSECRDYIKAVAKYVEKDRAKNYDEAQFDTLFDKFDDDKNGFIEKSEMAVFIK